MMCNKNSCSFSSSEEKVTEDFLGAALQNGYLEINDFSTLRNFSGNTEFWLVSKKSYKEENLTQSLNFVEVVAQPVNERGSPVEKLSKSIESMKDSNTILEPFKSSSDFITSPNRRFDLDLASREFASKLEADNTSSKSKKTYECHKCKEISFNRTSFIRHYKSHSAKNLTLCGDSQKVISHADQLGRNKRTYTLEKEFACNKCGKRFTHNYHLNRHYRIHNNKRPFECDKCKKAFKRKDNLTQHYQTHANEKPFVCDICGKLFVQKKYLVIHERTHTGGKPYECGICKRRFSDRSNLITHNRTHTNEMPFGCELCEKSFKNRSSLKLHRRKHKA